MQCITKTYCHQNGRQDWSSLLEFFPPWDYVNVTSMLMFAPNVSFRLQGSTISGDLQDTWLWAPRACTLLVVPLLRKQLQL